MSDYIRKSELIKELEKIHPRVNGIDVFWSVMKVVENQPTLDEKEIIRKPFERVVERLKRERIYTRDCSEQDHYFEQGIIKAIEIVKEECEINE